MTTFIIFINMVPFNMPWSTLYSFESSHFVSFHVCFLKHRKLFESPSSPTIGTASPVLGGRYSMLASALATMHTELSSVFFARTSLVIIMVSASRDHQCIVFHPVNNAVRFVDPSAPPACQVFFQRFRFTKAFVRRSLHILDQGIDPLQGFLVLGLPPNVIIPSAFVP